MTHERARQAANLVMAAAALGAAVFVVRSPKLRRTAWQLARQYAAGPLAAWTASTVRDAWEASARVTASEPRPSKDASGRVTDSELRRSKEASARATDSEPGLPAPALHRSAG
jgi:hypothetical protein